jgi:hypothetical protein
MATQKFIVMATQKFKQLPYGNSDFGKIRTGNFAYVDKTQYIEMLENESNPSHFFIRPRKFGKSLFFSMLSYYYDINQADKFEELFGDLYIGKHPTPEKNSYAILAFDFSSIDTLSEEKFIVSFSEKIRDTVQKFIKKYRRLLPDADKLIDKIEREKRGVSALEIAYDVADTIGVKIFVIIDEYDQFANDLIAMGPGTGKKFYKNMIKANGLVRDFYENLKIATKSSIVNRTFITGISPVMLDDLTSGYNIATILTLKRKYNEMMGFTQEEVNELMKITGVDPDMITIDMEVYYNGYLFHKDGENKVYNPSMVLYFFELILEGEHQEDIIDPNLKTDYGRIENLIKTKKNRDILIKIVKEERIAAKILQKFPLNKINNDDYFISLLFYMGLLTIKGTYYNTKLWLGMPNYSIKTLFWEYIREVIKDSSPKMSINTDLLEETIYAMAIDGDIHSFITYISQNIFSKLSDHDLQHFDEKYIKIMLLAYLFMSDVYIPMSEYEAVPGRTDIFLQLDPDPDTDILNVKYEWILELKYCKTDAKEAEISEKRNEGMEQLQKYVGSHRLGTRPDLKAALIVFTGKNKFEITEFEDFPK